MTKFYRDNTGHYIGGFDGAEPPVGAIEVPSAPASAFDTWNGSAWISDPIVPVKVTRRQALQALYLRSPSISASDIETAITTNLSGTTQGLALIEWRESLEFERSRPLVNSLGPLLGLTQADIDNLFITASTL